MSDGPQTDRIGLAAAAGLAVLGLWPHLWAVGMHPSSRDAVVWITRSDATGAHGLGWVLAEAHFKVGYRPITGLTFTLTDAIAGLAPLGHRLVDLGLHLGAALALVALLGRLLPLASRWSAPAAVAALVLHPVTEQVVPHLARRSYSLAALLSVLGLYTLLRWPRRPWLGAALLAAGALSNEVAYVALVVGAGLAWVAPADRREALTTTGVLAATVGALLVLRWTILDSLGGYASQTGRLERLPEVVVATLSGLGGTLEASGAVAAGTAVLLVALVGLCLESALRHGRQAVGAVAAMAAWLVGIFVVFAPQGVFFPRQVYLPMVPVALLVGLAATLAGRAEGWRRAALIAVATLTIVVPAVQGPVLRGPDPEKRLAWTRQDAALDALDGFLSDLRRRERVVAVLPRYQRPGIDALRARDHDGDSKLGAGLHLKRWLEVRHGKRLQSLAFVLVDPHTEGPAPILRGTTVDPGPAAIEWMGGPPDGLSQGSGPVDLAPLTDVRVFVHDGLQGRELEPSR